MRRPSPALLWILLMGAGFAIAATAAVNSTAAKAVAIGAGGFIGGISLMKLLFHRHS